jgi:hypothetical protein
MVREHAPAARVYEIPHLWEPPELPRVYRVERLRQSLGCTEGLLCGVFGHLRESKRIAPVIRAFGRVRGSLPVTLLLAGEFVSADLERTLAPLLASEGIARTAYLSETDWWLYASAVDLGINLKYPPAGETSGIAIRLMGIGKPVILTSGAETSRFPPGARLTVDPGVSEEEMLSVYLAWSFENRIRLEEIGRQAALHIRSEHAVERVADQYWRVLSDCYHES